MRITDLKCAIIGGHPVIRIVTDAGIDGFGQAEYHKPYLKPQVLALRDPILGLDPTDVERVMLQIRHRGGFKPHGAAVSAVEMALWDVAGKAAGVPVHKLLGGRVRDRVRVYNGAVRAPMPGQTPQDYAAQVRHTLAAPEGFTIHKQAIAFHSPMKRDMPGFMYSDIRSQKAHGAIDTGLLTERGMAHILDCVAAMKEVAGDRIGLALDCGPGWMLPDAIRFARAVEKHNLLWLEDLLTGDYSPHSDAAAYRDLSTATTSTIHTGEQIYLRQNFRALIESRAVGVIGPDPADVGGLAELKWIAEYAALHGIMIAPHGVANGLIGLAALVQVCACLPDNFIAFEYPIATPPWWADIVEGLPNHIVNEGFIQVGNRPGLGITLNPEAARHYLSPDDQDFFA